jgi:hypothetical protein
MVSLLSHGRFRRLRFQQVKGMNSPLDPRLQDYWEDRRTNALLRRAYADLQQRWVHLLKRQKSRCAITGLPLEETAEIVLHRIVPKQAGGNEDWNNLCLVLKWAQTALLAQLEIERQLASLKDVPFSGL